MRAGSGPTRALELDETEAEAYTALDGSNSADWDWRRSEQAFRRAIDLNPSLVSRVSGTSHNHSGHGLPEEARVQSATAIRLNPAAPETAPLRAECMAAGRVEEAIAQWQQVKDLDPH